MPARRSNKWKCFLTNKTTGVVTDSRQARTFSTEEEAAQYGAKSFAAPGYYWKPVNVG